MSEIIVIPQPLLEAAAVVRAEFDRELAFREALHRGAGEIATAKARLAEIEPLVQELLGQLAVDNALAGVASAERLSGGARKALDRQIAELQAERDALAKQAEHGEAVAAALQAKGSEGYRETERASAAKGLHREMRAFRASVDGEFRRDVGRLTLPVLFRKYGALAPICLGEKKLAEISIAGTEPPGAVPADGPAPVLLRGRYVAGAGATAMNWQGAAVDWAGAWRQDPALLALQAQLAEIVALDNRAMEFARGYEERRRQSAHRAAAEAARQSQKHSTDNPRPLAPPPGAVYPEWFPRASYKTTIP